ncbi:hypothetical protein BDZ45DRAFT_694073 [Acephala macrosclerotiorum]|nr:hypothetical protein BDZ45DRAFT_694073 [Acephala macrosclerotiorum]
MARTNATKGDMSEKLLEKTNSTSRRMKPWTTSNTTPQNSISATQQVCATQQNGEPSPTSPGFHQFSELPAGLRITIWKLAFPSGYNGQLMYPIMLRNLLMGPGVIVEGIPHFSFEIQTNAEPKSPISYDIKHIKVSRTNKESRAIYPQKFTKSSSIYRGVLKYPPNAIIVFDSFIHLFARYYCLYNEKMAKREALASLGKLKYAALYIRNFFYLIPLRNKIV